MGKIKVHEISRELGLTSKEIIEKANSLGIDVSSHLSSMDEDQAKKLKNSLSGKKEKTQKTTKSGKSSDSDKSAKKDKKNESPVIIRRDVIFHDENKKEEKPKTNKNSDVGFVERKKNQDYNIVYRNKTTKPMTFSELFGIKDSKKEKADKEKAKETVEAKNNEAKKAEKVEKVVKKEVTEATTKVVEKQAKTEDAESKTSVSEKKTNKTVDNNDKKEKPELTENKGMEQAVRKEYGNNNGYKRNDNYGQQFY